MSAVVSPGEFCQVVNNEDYNITIGWDGIDYVLKPGVKSIVPAEHVINFFGDPRSTATMMHDKDRKGVDLWIPDRASEVRRLRCKWAKFNNSIGAEDELIAPDVDVWTLEGDEVYTVAKDPKGDHINPSYTTQAQEMDRTALIHKLQEQLDYLIKSETMGNSTSEQSVTEDQIPVDEPTSGQPIRTRVIPKPSYDDDGDDS